MRRYYGIEILRLLTSLSVLLYHYRLFFAPQNPYSAFNFSEDKIKLPFYSLLEIFYNYGFYGVHVFYTISGFIFSYVYLSTDEKIGLKVFFINRFARLYPLHFATLIIVTILLFVNLFINNSFQVNPFHFDNFYHFILQLFFISAWGFDSGVSFNAPIWSVSIEIGIYILFFFLLAQLKKFKLWLAISLSFIFLSLDKLGLSDYTLFLECARLFFSGIIVYYITKDVKFNNLLFLVPLILIFLSFYGNFKTFLFCPALLLFFVLLENKIKKDIAKTFFKISGNLTYALYLLHYPIILSIIIIQEKFNLPGKIFLNTYFFFAFLSFLIIAAYFCFKLFEKPLNKKIRKIFLKKR